MAAEARDHVTARRSDAARVRRALQARAAPRPEPKSPALRSLVQALTTGGMRADHAAAVASAIQELVREEQILALGSAILSIERREEGG